MTDLLLQIDVSHYLLHYPARGCLFFDIKKLQAFNGEYIRKMPLADFVDAANNILTSAAATWPAERYKPEVFAAMAPLVFQLNGPMRGIDRDGVPEVPAAPVDPKTLSERVPACALSVFIGWLESTDSPVQEFGISNASLEEVFLAVTKNAAPVAQHNNEARTGCCSCCKKRRPKTSTELDNAIQSTNAIFTLKYTKLELKWAYFQY